jgi:hypothetical protein
MSILPDLKMYARFAWGLRGFLRHSITLEEAEAIVRRRMAEREENFLRVIERGIFGYPQIPYLPLLKLARCELGDIQNMVRAKGLEDTLRALREAGVYITFEEFKARKPIVRDGQEIPVLATDFDNPYLKPHYYARSGGTTGAGTRVAVELDHLAALAPNFLLAYEAYDVLGVPSAVWLSILPSAAGAGITLRQAHLGWAPKRWFSPVVADELRPSLKYRLATQYLVAMGRLVGAPIPRPEPLPLAQASVLARWMVDTLKTHNRCLLITQVSKALRVCLAAREEGLDLTGAAILAGGEPPTPAKVQTMTDVGVRWLVGYWFAEVGSVGLGCLNPADLNDIHLFKDTVALIQYPREVPGSGITVDAFHFTTLLPTAPKLMLNVESDDYGLVENRSCGCPLESYGFTDHVRDINSYRKLSGEGVTLVGSEMLHILEGVLPARFGGSPLDYQLLEEEDEQGFTRLSLLISPKIYIENEDDVIEAVLEALGEGSVAADFARAIWSQAGTLRVKRMEPVWTAQGKLMPLHMARHPSKQRP